jgi:hypothetical protein
MNVVDVSRSLAEINIHGKGVDQVQQYHVFLGGSAMHTLPFTAAILPLSIRKRDRAESRFMYVFCGMAVP